MVAHWRVIQLYYTISWHLYAMHAFQLHHYDVRMRYLRVELCVVDSAPQRLSAALGAAAPELVGVRQQQLRVNRLRVGRT